MEIQNELQRRLKDVVDTRYGGVASTASLAAGLADNAALKILRNPNHQPKLETFAKMADTYGWSLCDTIYWHLNRPVPPLTEGPGDQVIQRILAREGYSETVREFIREVLQRAERDQVPRTESS